MSKQSTLVLLLGVMLGVICTLSAWLVNEINRSPETAFGQVGGGGSTAMGGTGVIAATGNLSGKAGSGLYLYDAEKQRLVVYAIQGSKLLVLAARNCKYEWLADEFPSGRHDPGVAEMQKALQKR